MALWGKHAKPSTERTRLFSVLDAKVTDGILNIGY